MKYIYRKGNNMGQNKKIELTITPNYVSDWNFQDAIRELIQNL